MSIQNETLVRAMIEATRFLRAARSLRIARKRADEDTVGDYVPSTGREHAAVLRASMDLTRKLADLRAGR